MNYGLQGWLRKAGYPQHPHPRQRRVAGLVGSVHWKMLADLLGVADGTASAWHEENGADRAS
jgi:hypothetical protein